MQQWVIDAISTGYHCDQDMCYTVKVVVETPESVTLEFSPDVEYCTESSIETFRK